MEEKLSLSISIDRKISDGNYGSAGAFISLSGITAETTQADIDELLNGAGALAYKAVASKVNEKVKEQLGK